MSTHSSIAHGVCLHHAMQMGGAMLMGKEDGYKFICNVRQMTAPCLVMSLGR